MLMFVQRCLETTIDTYQKNDDLPQTRGFYPVIPRDALATAYAEFRDRLWTFVGQEAKQWKAAVQRLKSARLPSPFALEDVMKVCHITDPVDAREFLAVLLHLGVTSCANPDLPAEDRWYSFPVLFTP